MLISFAATEKPYSMPSSLPTAGVASTPTTPSGPAFRSHFVVAALSRNAAHLAAENKTFYNQQLTAFREENSALSLSLSLLELTFRPRSGAAVEA